jgi:hypothetical protein
MLLISKFILLWKRWLRRSCFKYSEARTISRTISDYTLHLCSLQMSYLDILSHDTKFKKRFTSWNIPHSFCSVTRSWWRSVSIVLSTDWITGGSIPGRSNGLFPLASVSRPSLRPTQPPVQWVPGVLSRGGKAWLRHDTTSAKVKNE